MDPIRDLLEYDERLRLNISNRLACARMLLKSGFLNRADHSVRRKVLLAVADGYLDGMSIEGFNRGCLFVVNVLKGELPFAHGSASVEAAVRLSKIVKLVASSADLLFSEHSFPVAGGFLWRVARDGKAVLLEPLVHIVNSYELSTVSPYFLHLVPPRRFRFDSREYLTCGVDTVSSYLCVVRQRSLLHSSIDTFLKENLVDSCVEVLVENGLETELVGSGCEEVFVIEDVGR